MNVFSTIDYTYNDAGQVITEGSTVAGSGVGGNGALRQLIYWRYPSGETAQITYPNGAVVNRDYTAHGQLAGVGWGAGSTSYAYLPDGKVDYQAWTNNVWTKFEYDGRGMTSSVRHKHTATNHDLAYREYWRDDRDRILAWKRGGPGGGGPNGMEDGRGDRYAYDEEGQLTSVSYRALDPAGTAMDAMRAEVFEYDKMGNRMGTHDLVGRGPTNFTRDNNGLNQYASWTPSVIKQDDDMGGDWGSPGHANGVTMQDGWITASFNALNQPMAMWCPTYGSSFLWFGYDPLGRCVKRWMGSDTGNAPNSNPATYLYYDGLNLVQEGSSAVIATRIYVHGAGVDQIVASQVSSGEWRYHHYDGQGNCILLTDVSGAIREQYDYDAFGMPYYHSAFGGRLGGSAQWGNRFLFTGREWLQDLRIYDYRARQYQPELGRFLQPDPKEFSAGDYNLYRYCHNDPVNKSDPTGLEQIAGDIIWDMAKHADSSNTSQGSFAELTHGAYMGDTGGGGRRYTMAGQGRSDGFPSVNPQAVLDAAEKYKSDIENAVQAYKHVPEGVEFGSEVLETRQGTLETTKMHKGNGITSVPGENRMAQTTTISNTNKDRQLVGYLVGYAHYNSGQVLHDVREAAKYSNIGAAVFVGIYKGRMETIRYVRGEALPKIPGQGYPY